MARLDVCLNKDTKEEKAKCYCNKVKLKEEEKTKDPLLSASRKLILGFLTSELSFLVSSLSWVWVILSSVIWVWWLQSL